MKTLNERFTPAYAGKIYAPSDVYIKNGVHPRIRGEDRQSTTPAHSASGSPPHTRGRLTHARPAPGRAWFTPAYAGKIGYSRP